MNYWGVPYRLPSEEISFVHYHDCFELCVCTQGSGLFLSRNVVEPIRAGDTALTLPGVRHYSKSLDDCLCRFVYVDPYSLFGAVGITDKLFMGLVRDSAQLDIPVIFRSAEYPELHDLLAKAVNGYAEAAQPDADLMAVYRLLAVRLAEILLLCRERFTKVSGPDPVHSVLVPALEYISLHYDKAITVDELAGLCHLTKSTLRRKFQEGFRLAPFAYLNRFRCRTAAMMLLHTDYPIADIAGRVGYPDVSNFYRNFVAWKRVSPSEFRKAQRTGGEGAADAAD